MRAGDKQVKTSISAGFTLIEVLVATAIASALLAALYATFFSVLRGRTGLEGKLERAREVSRFLDVFSREIESAFYKDNNPRTGFTGQAGDFKGRPASTLELTAFGYPALRQNTPQGDLLTVRYSASQTPSGKLTLYKETWNPYAAQARKAVLKAEVIEDIEGFEVSYFNGKDWAKAWDSKTDKRLPVAVRAVVAVNDSGAVNEYAALARTMMR